MNEQPLPIVQMYTDGASLGNPGPGGYGVILSAGDKEKEYSAGYRLTTNNRMELLAVITGLAALKQRCRVNVFSDSQYVVNGISKGWAKSWQKKGWRKADGQPALNPDLWQQLLSLTEKHQVTINWVRGHDGNVLNERADKLATAAARSEQLKEDTGFTKGQK